MHAIMHDVGKISIPDMILNKPGRLTKEEFEIMKTHLSVAVILLENVERLRKSNLYPYAYDICRHHHERYDGNGYPDGLKGDEISVWAQVVSLADVYDALVNERVY
jgi:putative two-component system response regulator